MSFSFLFLSRLCQVSFEVPVVSILNEILREEVSQELKLRPHAASQGMEIVFKKLMGNYSVRMYEEKI